MDGTISQSELDALFSGRPAAQEYPQKKLNNKIHEKFKGLATQEDRDAMANGAALPLHEPVQTDCPSDCGTLSQTELDELFKQHGHL